MNIYHQLKIRIRLLRRKNKEPYLSLATLLGYCPGDFPLYEQALLHKSTAVADRTGHAVNNERLEYLGDALLDAIVADILYKRYPSAREGFLTEARAKLVRRDTLDKLALQLGLNKLVIFASQQANAASAHMYGNALEALVGAVYLDRGYADCYRFVSETLYGQHLDIDKFTRQTDNYKSLLVEWSQKYRIATSYDIKPAYVDTDGNPVFEATLRIGDEVVGQGVGYTKRAAEQAAAGVAMRRIRSDKSFQKHLLNARKQKQQASAEAEDAAASGAEHTVDGAVALQEAQDVVGDSTGHVEA